jgi:putative permease
MNVIAEWFRRHLSDPQIVILVGLLFVGSVVVIGLGHILAPVLASVVVAYLLEGLVRRLTRHRVPRLLAVLVVFLSFMVFLLFLILRLLPLLWQQMVQLFQELPSMIAWSQRELLRLPERFPDYISEQQVIDLISVLRSELTGVGQRILSLSAASIRGIVSILLYIFIMPLLVFFFLKDKERLINWVTGFLPPDRSLANEVWRELDQQIGNYVRGKVWEIFILWAASYVTFKILGLQFAMLISFFVGLSVLVPYIGAIVMVLPVASIGFFQWGWSSQFAYVVAAYIIIQILDGNVLVTFLYSEVVNLHPVAVVLAVLTFGGLWGFWGVFFAIPLATLVHAVIKAWARRYRRKGSLEGEIRGAKDVTAPATSDPRLQRAG